ncbi:galaxin-like [Sphaeramia orbicularis]|uniref:galaxin-like n=1 Tax=Sphaeramia orbicularis TaxID=375764 RepID=UPI00117C30EB|nr:galaxin-like [Sphaeramia orbicularis]
MSTGVQQQRPRSQLNCAEPHTAVCGSTCYNPNLLDCCLRNNTNCETSGHCGDVAPTVFNPRTHFCCYGHVIDRNPWMEEFPCSPEEHCCGGNVYNPETHICCNQHRWHKGEHIRCCGAEAYNISDTQMKCCGGNAV